MSNGYHVRVYHDHGCDSYCDASCCVVGEGLTIHIHDEAGKTYERAFYASGYWQKAEYVETAHDEQ